jgi:hypothetical protein
MCSFVGCATNAVMTSPLHYKASLQDPWPCRCDADDAVQELQQVMGRAKILDEMPALDTRSLSAGSTSATNSTGSMSPALSSDSPPLACASPKIVCRHPLVSENVDHASSGTEKVLDTPKQGRQHRHPSWLQARKVFVGGVPQNIDEKDLFRLFSQLGRVRKAWLQRAHFDIYSGEGVAEKKHRGFGFVIFHDECTVEQMLGEEFSKFICFEDSLKLEVKRAVSKTVSAVATLDGMHNSVAQDPFSRSSSDSSQSDGIGSPPLQSWQAVSWLTPFAEPLDASSMLPLPSCLPVFASAHTLVAQKPVEIKALSVCSHLQANSPQSKFALPMECPFLQILLDGFAGQRPCNAQELERMLLNALPERYED